MIRLGHGADSFGTVWDVGGGHGAWPQLAGWFEQRAAQVVQQAQPGVGGVHAAPSSAGAVQHGPDQGEAAGLAGKPADDLDPVPLEYSIEWLTCTIASRPVTVMVGWPGAAQDRLLASSPGTRPGRPGIPRRSGEGC